VPESVLYDYIFYIDDHISWEKHRAVWQRVPNILEKTTTSIFGEEEATKKEGSNSLKHFVFINEATLENT